MKGITVESLVSQTWVEGQYMKKQFPNFNPSIKSGKYQYVYSSAKGRISLLFESRMILDHRENFWEILCLEGDLFEGPERFGTRAVAENRIKELLQ